MHIQVTGFSKTKHLSKVIKVADVKKIVERITTKLMPRISDDIKYVIMFTDGKTMPKDHEASAAILGGKYAARPREFEIIVNSNVHFKSFVRYISHELLHVKQWSCGKMYEGAGFTTWLGRRYSNNYQDKNYWYLPWEIEARGYEDALMWFTVHSYGCNSFRQLKTKLRIK